MPEQYSQVLAAPMALRYAPDQCFGRRGEQ
jgi:hypothetical protein